MTTRYEISAWFDDGKTRGATHLIVVCDTFDHEDYPVYADSDKDCLEKVAEYNGKNMQRLMEVYDLQMPKDAQLNEIRAFHLPGAQCKTKSTS